MERGLADHVRFGSAGASNRQIGRLRRRKQYIHVLLILDAQLAMRTGRFCIDRLAGFGVDLLAIEQPPLDLSLC